MYILSNTAISLDGRIDLTQHHVALGSSEDRKRMHALRAQADAVLVGGNTFRNFPHPIFAKIDLVKDAPSPCPLPRGEGIKGEGEYSHTGVTKKPIWNVILSESLNLPNIDTLLSEPKVRPLVLTGNSHTPAEFNAEIARAPDSAHPAWIVAELEKRGVETLLIEGGGKVIYQFLKAGLLNEMYVTLTPKVIGLRDAPSLADGTGFPDLLKPLTLRHAETIGDEVYLRYTVNT